MNDSENIPPVEVPFEAISEDALKGLIDSFILREGTDYGKNEVDHQVKHSQVHKQIAKGDVKIMFDPNTGTITLINKLQWQKLFSR